MRENESSFHVNQKSHSHSTSSGRSSCDFNRKSIFNFCVTISTISRKRPGEFVLRLESSTPLTQLYSSSLYANVVGWKWKVSKLNFRECDKSVNRLYFDQIQFPPHTEKTVCWLRKFLNSFCLFCVSFSFHFNEKIFHLPPQPTEKLGRRQSTFKCTNNRNLIELSTFMQSDAYTHLFQQTTSIKWWKIHQTQSYSIFNSHNECVNV